MRVDERFTDLSFGERNFLLSFENPGEYGSFNDVLTRMSKVSPV